jgi:hypothetical protein
MASPRNLIDDMLINRLGLDGRASRRRVSRCWEKLDFGAEVMCTDIVLGNRMCVKEREGVQGGIGPGGGWVGEGG